MKDCIEAAYKGEIYGIAFFSYFANHYADRSRLPLWSTLIEVETLTATLLEQCLKQANIDISRNDEAMRIKGQSDAENWVSLPWNKLIEVLILWVEPYENQYRQWAENSEVETHAFALIAAHETAIFNCLKAEQRGETGMPILVEFLKQYSTAA